MQRDILAVDLSNVCLEMPTAIDAVKDRQRIASSHLGRCLPS
jgi:hypothetical protein